LLFAVEYTDIGSNSRICIINPVLCFVAFSFIYRCVCVCACMFLSFLFIIMPNSSNSTRQIDWLRFGGFPHQYNTTGLFIEALNWAYVH